MFVIVLTYVKPVADVDVLIPAHRKFLARHYASGHFLMSGRRKPRKGGVILATATDREEIQTIIEQDPFYLGGVAEYNIIEFTPTMAAERFAEFTATL